MPPGDDYIGKVCVHPGLQSEADLATLVARSMKEKDNGSVELLLVLDGILQVGGCHMSSMCTWCMPPHDASKAGVTG